MGRGGQAGMEDAPVVPPAGHGWWGTHLQGIGILFLPAAPMEEEEEEEEGGCERSREGALQGASHSTGLAR